MELIFIFYPLHSARTQKWIRFLEQRMAVAAGLNFPGLLFQPLGTFIPVPVEVSTDIVWDNIRNMRAFTSRQTVQAPLICGFDNGF